MCGRFYLGAWADELEATALRHNRSWQWWRVRMTDRAMVSLGADPRLRQGGQVQLPHDQRPGRDGGGETGVSHRLSTPALPGPRQWLFRVASDKQPYRPR